MIKSVEELNPSDLERFPVWEFVNDDARGETMVRPVERVPVESLNNRLIGTSVRLANGDLLQALMGNIDVNSPRYTQHFLTLTIFNDGECFFLARYHDVLHNTHGPAALAEFLGLKTDEVFPIAYDVRE